MGCFGLGFESAARIFTCIPKSDVPTSQFSSKSHGFFLNLALHNYNTRQKGFASVLGHREG